MKAVILSAGRATRMRHAAPQGCKVLTEVDGATVLERQLDILHDLGVEDVTVVCRTPHLPLLDHYLVNLVAHDALDGPVGAVRAAKPQGDTLIVYGDTLWTGLPEGSEWIGVAEGQPGRKWDVVDPGGITYRHLYTPAWVCVGLYRLAQAQRLEGPTMPAALRAYDRLPYAEVSGWHDVGDEASARAYEKVT